MNHPPVLRVMYLLVFSLLASLAQAQQVRYPPRPAQGEYLLDEAKLLNESDAAEIRKICGDVMTRKKAPIVVVTITSLADYGVPGWPIPRYAMNLFSEWGVGRSDWNYGVLFLVSKG